MTAPTRDLTQFVAAPELTTLFMELRDMHGFPVVIESSYTDDIERSKRRFSVLKLTGPLWLERVMHQWSAHTVRDFDHESVLLARVLLHLSRDRERSAAASAGCLLGMRWWELVHTFYVHEDGARAWLVKA